MLNLCNEKRLKIVKIKSDNMKKIKGRTAQNRPWLNFILWTILTSILIFPMYCAVHWDSVQGVSIAIVVSVLEILWIGSLFIQAKQVSYTNQTGEQLKLNKVEAIVVSFGKFIVVLLIAIIIYLMAHMEVL